MRTAVSEWMIRLNRSESEGAGGEEGIRICGCIVKTATKREVGPNNLRGKATALGLKRPRSQRGRERGGRLKVLDGRGDWKASRAEKQWMGWRQQQRMWSE